MASQATAHIGGIKGTITTFATHKVAANLLMSLTILMGFWGLGKLNSQLFPSFDFDFVSVTTIWSGASAEDVEQAITSPIEQELRGLTNVRKIRSTSSPGSSVISIELEEGTDLGFAVDDVKQRVSNVRNLPQDAEDAVVNKVERVEQVARLLISGPGSLEELRPIVKDFERQLVARGISKIDFIGLPNMEIAVQVNSQTLHELGLGLPQLAALVRDQSKDLPAGIAGRSDVEKQVRAIGQQRDERGFSELPIIADTNGALLRLGDVADVALRPRLNQPTISQDGRSAIEMVLTRTESEDTLDSADILATWLQDITPTLPPGIKIEPYSENWFYLKDRIDLLLKNGIGGLILVIGMLFLFLNVRIAWWVAAGIPISFLAALVILYLLGGTINLISLFAFIMVLGIIVDDAIVVGENVLANLQNGESHETAAVSGAMRMLAPVVSSSLTTIAAFLPLLLIGGVFGNILIDIPIVVICVIIASLVECFLILPGHLHHSFKKFNQQTPGKLRTLIDQRFNQFRDGRFRSWAEKAITYRWITVFASIAALVMALGLLAGGRVQFNFFPTIDGNILNANVEFTQDTAPATKQIFLDHLEDTLLETNRELGGNLIRTYLTYHDQALFTSQNLASLGGDIGPEYGAVKVEINTQAIDDLTNDDIIRRWRDKIQLPSGIKRFVLEQLQGGPPGKPIAVRFTGKDVEVLKSASLELQAELEPYQGVSNIDDDLPFGEEQLIYNLTPLGKALNLSLENVGRQIRAALDGELVQIFYDGDDDIEVRVVLPNEQRDQLSGFDQLPIVIGNNETVALGDVVNFTVRQGIDTLRRVDGLLSVTVSADVDVATANANEINATLQQTVLPELASKYGIGVDYDGRVADQAETFSDMVLGAYIGLALIYIILAWVFASYSWPIVVMLAIPFGLTGAIFGHWVLDADLTLFSLFGFFALSGIVINDSIVLITFYKDLRVQGMAIQQAIVEATCQRLRAVLLTSLTTMAGLTPMLFETSIQAQFLIPVAITLIFGLLFGTVLILLMVPAQLTILEHGKDRIARAKAWVFYQTKVST